MLSLIGLAVVLVVLAGQPCFADTVQPGADCCRHHTRCHEPSPAPVCAMQATQFTLPEPAGAMVTLAAVSGLTPEFAAPASASKEMPPVRHLIESSGLYLRNSVLLI